MGSYFSLPVTYKIRKHIFKIPHGLRQGRALSFLSFFLPACLLIFFPDTGNGQANLCRQIPENEHLTYKAFYNAGFFRFYGGTVTFSCRHYSGFSGIPRLELVSTGKTLPKYNWFYRIDDRYQAQFYCQAGSTETFEQQTSEGNKKLHWRYYYDISNREVTITDMMKGDTLLIHDTVLPMDILTAVYRCRFLPFDTCTATRKFYLRVLLNNSTETIEITYHHQGSIRLNKSAPRDSYFFTARVPGGTLFRKDKDLRIWVSADRQRVPLLVEAPVVIGSVMAVLQLPH
ncbi:MAG: DUF3108 domain-containing protein [Chlorobi bacterium]|nr:DUF3108 domain-containing protein [Chlorobiota bacterium]